MAQRRRATALRGLLVAVALVFAPLAACGDDDDAGVDTTTTTAADTTTTTSDDTTTSTTRPGTTAPDEIVAVLGDGSVALIDADDGDVTQTLLEGIDVSDPAKNGITLSPDGDAFVVRPTAEAGDDHEIVRVSPDGGESEVVVRGRAPAVSPDGATLAYVEVETQDSPGQPAPVLVLHDLETGEEERLRREQEPDFFFVADMAWTGDGEQLALVTGEIQTGLHIVDVDAESLDDARRLGPEGRQEGTSWTAVTAFGDGTLAVVETCCDVPPEERWDVLTVDPSTGAVEDDPLTDRLEASRVDSDESAQHLLAVTGLRPGGGTLVRWSPPDATGGTGDADVDQPVEVRDDVVVAAW